MVNLLQMYEANGFELSTRELPDYIPLFLEFLSQQTKAEAVQLLQDAMPVLSLLGARLTERGSEFRAIFDCAGRFCRRTRSGWKKFAIKPPAKARMRRCRTWMKYGKKRLSVLWEPGIPVKAKRPQSVRSLSRRAMNF